MARREGYASLDPSVRSRFLPQKRWRYFPERMILHWNYSSAIALRPPGSLRRGREPPRGRRPRRQDRGSDPRARSPAWRLRHAILRCNVMVDRRDLTTVRRCMEEGLVGGEGFAADASLIRA